MHFKVTASAGMALLILSEGIICERIRIFGGSHASKAISLLSSRGETVIEGEGLVLTPSGSGGAVTVGESEKETAETGGETTTTTTTGENGATVIEGEGIVLTPGGETTEGAKKTEGTPQTIEINGVPFQVSGNEISVNGKPLEEEGAAREDTGRDAAEAGGEGKGTAEPKNTTGTALEVAGSDVLVGGKPVETANKANGTATATNSTGG